jgi:hypothetical protein
MDIIFLIFGFYTVITGKLPAFIIGSNKYTVDKLWSRIIGLLLMLPLPFAIFFIFLLVIFVGEDGVAYGICIELVFLVLAVGAALILYRIVRKPLLPDASLSEYEIQQIKIKEKIAKKANGALLYAASGILGIFSIIFCPLAFIYATQAANLIKEYNLGGEYLVKANLARILAIVLLFINGCLMVGFLRIFLAGAAGKLG